MPGILANLKLGNLSQRNNNKIAPMPESAIIQEDSGHQDIIHIQDYEN